MIVLAVESSPRTRKSESLRRHRDVAVIEVDLKGDGVVIGTGKLRLKSVFLKTHPRCFHQILGRLTKGPRVLLVFPRTWTRPCGIIWY